MPPATTVIIGKDRFVLQRIPVQDLRPKQQSVIGTLESYSIPAPPSVAEMMTLAKAKLRRVKGPPPTSSIGPT